MSSEIVIQDREVIIEELKNFVYSFTKKPKKRNKTQSDEDFEEQLGKDLEDNYPLIYEAIEEGLFIYLDGKVTLKLEFPVLNDKKEISFNDVTFKTRIKPSDQERLSIGLNLQKQSVKFAMRMFSHIIDQPVSMLDKFSKEDYKKIQEICGVFM